MTTFIIIATIGWLISLITAIMGLMVGWRDKNKIEFNKAVILLVFSIPGGFFIGWLLVGIFIKTYFIDSHFDNDRPGQVKG